MLVFQTETSQVERLRNSVSGDMEYVCTDRKTNEGYRTSCLEIAKEWCSWSTERRMRHYSDFAKALHSIGL